MQKNYQTKDISSASNETSEQETKMEAITEEYFYPGSGEYEPVTVKATSLAKAEEEWLKVRKKINS